MGQQFNEEAPLQVRLRERTRSPATLQAVAVAVRNKPAEVAVCLGTALMAPSSPFLAGTGRRLTTSYATQAADGR